LFLSRFEVLPKSKTLKSTRNENFLLGNNFNLLKNILYCIWWLCDIRWVVGFQIWSSHIINAYYEKIINFFETKGFVQTRKLIIDGSPKKIQILVIWYCVWDKKYNCAKSLPY
jgi:hypothetical protein